MTRPGNGPGSARRTACLVAAAVLVAGIGTSSAVVFGGAAVSASGRRGGDLSSAHSSATTTTTTESPWVPGTGGTITIGIDQAPTGCNPNTASGDTWADRLLLEPVLPSAFTVDAADQPVYNSALITQAELQSTSPETVVYTINPSAVWSDGTPVTATDFIYTWQQERGTGVPVGTSPTTASATTTTTTTTTTAASSTSVARTSGSTSLVSASTASSISSTSTSHTTTPVVTPPAITTPKIATNLPGATGTTGPTVGYRQIASVTAGAKSRTVTVVFKTPYEDWQSLFDDLLPAHVLETTGWNPRCTSLDPAIDLSAGPFLLEKVVPGKEVVLARNPKWWGQVPALQDIVVRIASGPAQLSQWLADGTVDVALPTGYHEQFLQAVTSQPSVLTQSQLSTTFLQLEFSTTSTFTSSTDLRLAIAHAIDRQSLVNQVVGWADSTIVPGASHLHAQGQPGYPAHKPPLQVSGQPGTTTTTAPSTSSTSTPFPPGADLAATTQLFTASGVYRTGTGPWKFLTGTPFRLQLAVDVEDPWASDAAAVLAQQLDAAGIEVGLVDAPSAQAAGADLADGSVDIALIPMHSSPYPSQAIAWYTPLLGTAGTDGSQDWTGFDDPTVNALLEKASQQLNPVDADPLYSEVDATLWQQMIALPLFTQPSVLAWNGLTAGVSPNANGPSLLWDALSWATRVPPTSPEAQP